MSNTDMDDGVADAISQQEYPWRDPELMERLYIDEQLSVTQIAERMDCAFSTVRNWIHNHGIPMRSPREGALLHHGSTHRVPYETRERGACVWRVSDHPWGDFTVYVHRLIAVAKYGAEAVAGMDVHHKNGLAWDNRPENIELLTHGEHTHTHKKKVRGLDRLRIAELYENGGVGSYLLTEQLDYDIDPVTVRDIHEEFYGEHNE